MKHTPGPWSVDGFNLTGVIALISPRTKVDCICECKTDSNPMDLEEAKANARLIAAAPELLEALHLILPLAKGYVAKNNVGSNQKYIEIAEQAILKAEGDSP